MVNRGRHSRLLKLLAKHESLSVAQLVEALHASTPTIRRDLAWLAARKLLTRTRGGAAYRHPDTHCLPLVSTAFASRLHDNLASKRAIARYAAGMCPDGSSVVINGGTTTFMMTEFLVGKQLKVLTNSFLIARDLLDFSASEVMLLGGTVYREQQLMMSPFDSGIAHQHDSARIFMGISALSPLGLMEADPRLIQAALELINQAEDLIVLADSSKFARKGELILCGLPRVSCVITDTGVTDADVQWMERAGIRVVTVELEALVPQLAVQHPDRPLPGLWSGR